MAGLVGKAMGDKLLRVRLGSKAGDLESLTQYGQAFATVPYSVQGEDRAFPESSARSRGFKFATISGVTAYLSKATQVVVPESGQGSLGQRLCL